MNQKLLAIKNQIIDLRKNGSRRIRIPKKIRQEINHISQLRPLEEICQVIGIDLNNARQRINKFKNKLDLSPEVVSPLNLIQLSNSPSQILELNLANGTLIWVFSV